MSKMLLAAALAATFMTLPSKAENYRHFSRPHPYDYAGSKGYGTGPYYQGTPTDRLPIWRNGYYQGNDPDQFILCFFLAEIT